MLCNEPTARERTIYCKQDEIHHNINGKQPVAGGTHSGKPVQIIILVVANLYKGSKHRMIAIVF